MTDRPTYRMDSWMIAAEPDLVAKTRRQVLDTARQWGSCPTGESADDLRLLISELVTNGVRHTPACVLTLTLVAHGRHLYFEVMDGGTGGVPVVERPDADQEHGRGMLLVDALATCWGYRQTPSGNAVWFILTLPAPEPPATSP
ncbi:ATP-binding protein [Streptomyces sp. Root431]|uniref:ATP-binding protein n=1 Tax=Streptomyces sp. Root431 TaxID=1736535 RepID=UPI000A3F8E2E|nr:ATP-binding protein [Streptomyces sp. Root431]